MRSSTAAVWRNPCVSFTESAASKIKDLLTEEGKNDSGLRVFVQGGGCSGFQYGLMIEENGGDCIGAYWHHPLFSAGTVHGGLARSRPFWNLLYEYGAEWVLNGNDHAYQRLAPQSPAGALYHDRGISHFEVWT